MLGSFSTLRESCCRRAFPRILLVDTFLFDNTFLDKWLPLWELAVGGFYYPGGICQCCLWNLVVNKLAIESYGTFLESAGTYRFLIKVISNFLARFSRPWLSFLLQSIEWHLLLLLFALHLKMLPAGVRPHFAHHPLADPIFESSGGGLVLLSLPRTTGVAVIWGAKLPGIVDKQSLGHYINILILMPWAW